jgi:alkylresorcinol/alkylpyrone synthase
VLYRKHARRLAAEAAAKALASAGLTPRQIDAVITVSCTGYVVPALDVDLVDDLGLRPDVVRVPITELGCSAGAAAIGAAHRHLLAMPGDRVLVVAVEVPSLTFQQSDRSLDNQTACLVFGDGAGAAVMGRPRDDRARLEVVRTASHLIPGTREVLGFDLRDGGFHVVLDRRLPRILLASLRPVVDRFLAESELPHPAFYAVHAAGPRVFRAVEAALDLPSHALDVSREVFEEAGNTSSSAIFFALEKLLRKLPPGPAQGLGLGLGPGIAIELMHLAAVPARVQPRTSVAVARTYQ